MLLEPSGMSSNVPTGPSGIFNGPGGASAVDGSGMLGDMCQGNAGTAQLVLGIGDRVSAVNVTAWNTGGVTGLMVRCILTYGNVNVQNTLKDGEYGRGS